MNRVSRLLVCLMCNAVITFSYAQENSLMKSPLIFDAIPSSDLVVCKLVGPEFQKRKAELQKQVFAKVTSYKEVENGYVFSFIDQADMLETLADYMLTEHKCCPFFDFDLSVKAHNGGIEWTISGPPQVKDMIGSLLEKD